MTVWKLEADGGKKVLQDQACMLMSVIVGEGTLNGKQLKKEITLFFPTDLTRQVLQVEDPVWVWTIKYRRVAAFRRGYLFCGWIIDREPNKCY